jgi:flavin reductase (DIM6/NTAB) family NADH-FMN oxidoreductase RutF
MMDAATRKQVLRLFTYGLYAITVAEGERCNAFTANWLTQVSFEPPLVAISVENTSVSLPMIQRTRHFVINVYAADQRTLAGQLGHSLLTHPDKLAGLSLAMTASGAPYVPETLAHVECEVESLMPAGDSSVVIARVVDVGQHGDGEPLTMKAAGFRHAG